VLVYLGTCMIMIPASIPTVPTCNMNSKYNTGTFIFWVLWPLVSVRTIGYVFFRNSNFNVLRNLSLLLNVQWNLSFGIWTYVNLYKLIKMNRASPVKCTITA